MRSSLRIFFVVIYVLLALCANAQSMHISGDFRQLRFEQFVTKVESLTGYHFYYNDKELDTFTVNVSVSDITLNKLLTMVFTGTNYKFAADEDHHVFITVNAPLSTIVPADFFDKKIIAPSLADNNAVDTLTNKRKQKLHSAAENKIYEIGVKGNSRSSKPVLTGSIRDVRSGEALPGAIVRADSLAAGVVTDQFGSYVLSLPAGKHSLSISSLGMKETKRSIIIYSDGKLDIEMEDDIPSLKNVTVSSERRGNIRGTQMGTERLTIKTIKQVPVVFGEADILRVVLALPGVTSVGEASTGFNVRGGSADQNLILLNDATVYNPSHLFGFFSAFNPDIVKGVELYKSAIPVKYGGRISSVLDVTTKDGNDKKLTGIAGIGPLTSKVTIEGPLQKDKASFIVGGRTTYSNWLLKSLRNSEYSNSRASFYDLNLHVSDNINAKNSIYLTGYMSSDKFQLNNDTSYKYGNKNLVIKWKHVFNSRFFSVVSAGADQYNYGVSSTSNAANAFLLAFDIDQKSFRSDFTYTPNNRHSFNFGINTIHYKLLPGSFTPEGSGSLVVKNVLETEKALESALYVGDSYAIDSKLLISGGIRFSMFNNFGPRNVYSYVPGIPKDASTITDTSFFASGKIIKTYHGPEYRFSLRYGLTNDASIKFSFNTLRQYIHMLSNTVSVSPTDVWKLSDAYIKPQQGKQFSFGLYKNFNSNAVETSVEFYYKTMDNFLDYKSGAQLLLNKHIETDVINTTGRAYGAEFMVKKTSGKLNGWISYTYSNTRLKTDDESAGEKVNKGEYYPASFDKPHNINVISNFRFSHRFSMSANFVYNTGRPITLPIATFTSGGGARLLYSDRNQYRIPDYIRADISFNLDGNHKVKQALHNSWSAGVYNLFARKNAYSVYFVQEGPAVKGYQLSIFGTAIPYITYNFRF